MASLVRVTTIRYLDAEGRQVPKGTPKARKARRRSKKWYGKGIPGWPPSKRVPLATDRDAAQRLLDDLVRRAERGQTDLPDAAAGRVPLAEHLARFGDDLALGLATRKKGASRRPGPKQVTQILQRVGDVLAGCRLATAAEFAAAGPHAVARHLARRIAAGDLAHQSADHVVKDLRRFAWWLAKVGCPVRADLFDGLPGYDPDSHRTRRRRPITPAEMAALLVACDRPDHHSARPRGADRRVIYLLAYSTGFRAEELAKLTPAHFALDADPPQLVVRAGEGKNRKRVAQPLPVAVAEQLRAYLAGRPPNARVWPGKWYERAAVRLYRDLRAAGIEPVADTPDGPAVLDFHALRHSYATAIVETGATVKEAQELLRHSDPRLTLNVYAHARPAALAAVVERLALPGGTGGPTLATLSRPDLEALAAVLLVLAASVALPVAPTDGRSRHTKAQPAHLAHERIGDVIGPADVKKPL